MNKTLAEAVAWVDDVVAAGITAGIQAFVLPPHTALATVRDRLGPDSPIMLGAQNAHWAAEGAGTGEVSMRMVADAGARIVEMGHSERREQFGETDETVALKAAAALDHDLIPLICVGEPAEVRAAGDAEDFVSGQVRAGLSRIGPDQVGRVIVAYEPIWAIGTGGRPATGPEIRPVVAAIDATLREAARGGSARALLYGGGVDASNARDLLSDQRLDGVFVGRAGWSAGGFITLLELCAAM